MLCEKQALFGLFSFRIDREKDLFNRLFDGPVLGFVAEICREIGAEQDRGRDRDLLPLNLSGIYRKGLAACFCVIGFRHD
jgi:hypothetical protein